MTLTTVILDIGHGTDTRGKGVGGHKEHDFNSKLGLAIKRILEQHNVGVVFGQQPFSKDVPLRERTNFYNSTNAKLSVSIHANASSNASVNGRCVFYWHDDAQAKRLAVNIRNEIRDAGYSTHGSGLHESKRGSWTNLHMVREPKMPAVLIEHGFMTGNKDFSLIFGADQGTYIRDMAEADSRAILDYLGMQYKEPTEEVEVVMSNDLYRVQVGAFSDKANAERLAAELKAKGYPVFIPDAKEVTLVEPSSAPKPAPKPKKSAREVADEIYKGDGNWGNNPGRKQKLEAEGYDYNEVQSLVEELLKGQAKPKKPTRTVDQMAREILNNPNAPTGHENRRKWLGISQSEYKKVRARVNKLA